MIVYLSVSHPRSFHPPGTEAKWSGNEWPVNVPVLCGVQVFCFSYILLAWNDSSLLTGPASDNEMLSIQTSYKYKPKSMNARTKREGISPRAQTHGPVPHMLFSTVYQPRMTVHTSPQPAAQTEEK